MGKLLRFFAVLAAIGGLAAVLALVYGNGAGKAPVSRTRYLMGTLVQITAYGDRAEAAVEAAFDRMAAIERETGGDPSSDISRLNAAAGKSRVRIGPDAWRLLTLANTYRKLTGGTFDVTVGPLVNLWGFGYGGEGRFPAPEEVARMLPLVGRAIDLRASDRTAMLPATGMSVTMGGIAKGYAVEEAVRVLRVMGVENALVNGGNSSIKAIGEGPQGRGWRIGVGDPRRPGKMLGVITLTAGQALATSGDDQRYFIKNGRRYTHIIDPRTGYPAAAGVAQVTVVSTDATRADILTKALFLHGQDLGLRFAREMGMDALFVDDRGGRRSTPGFPLAEVDRG